MEGSQDGTSGGARPHCFIQRLRLFAPDLSHDDSGFTQAQRYLEGVHSATFADGADRGLYEKRLDLVAHGLHLHAGKFQSVLDGEYPLALRELQEKRSQQRRLSGTPAPGHYDGGLAVDQKGHETRRERRKTAHIYQFRKRPGVHGVFSEGKGGTLGTQGPSHHGHTGVVGVKIAFQHGHCLRERTPAVITEPREKTFHIVGGKDYIRTAFLGNMGTADLAQHNVDEIVRRRCVDIDILNVRVLQNYLDYAHSRSVSCKDGRERFDLLGDPALVEFYLVKVGEFVEVVFPELSHVVLRLVYIGQLDIRRKILHEVLPGDVDQSEETVLQGIFGRRDVIVPFGLIL